jgi:hypothetical protein
MRAAGTAADRMMGWAPRSRGLLDDLDRAEPRFQAMATAVARVTEQETVSGVDLVMVTMERRDSINAESAAASASWAMTDEKMMANPFAVGNLAWERVTDRELKLWHFRWRKESADVDVRTSVFYPDRTGQWQVVELASPVFGKVVDPVSRRRMRKVHVHNLEEHAKRTWEPVMIVEVDDEEEFAQNDPGGPRSARSNWGWTLKYWSQGRG